MRLRFSIAVAGSHGKTTTTSMIALVLERGGLDPTAVIGGRLSAFGSNARLGRGEYMVAEADESDRSFLMLWPSIAVMTNIDHEHMESYGSFAELQQAFVDFANKVPFYGAVVACVDDANLAAILPRVKRQVVTYGLDHPQRADRRHRRRARRVRRPLSVHRRTREGMRAARPPRADGAGRHNLQNALAAVAVSQQIGMDFARVAAALAGFHGAERRFERHGEAGGVLVVDDYGHHPTEIAAVLAAARATLDRRLIVAFQPHRYSRTAQLLDAFGPALAGADEIVLTDIYAAGEDPIPGITIERLAESIRSRIGSSGARGQVADRRRARAADDRPSRRRRDHARRRIDRHGAEAARGGARTERVGALMPVAAPADKRFRRAHVSPTRRRSWRPSWWTIGRLVAVGAVVAFGMYRAVDLALSAEALTVTPDHRPRQRPAVARRGAGAARGPPRREHGDGRSGAVAPEAARRPRGSPTPRCAACCRARSPCWCPSDSRWPSAASATCCI